MESKLLLGLFLVFSSAPAWGEKNRCVMYDCGVPAPCAYEGPPKSLENQAAVKVLQSICPALNIEKGSKVCCSPGQIQALNDQLAMLGALFGRCPSCLYNVRNTFCNMVCSPDQSNFLSVVNTTARADAVTFGEERTPAPPSGVGLKEVVSVLEYYISDTFVSGAYDSCKDVLMPVGNVKAMTVACGSYGDQCNDHHWFDFMGDNPFAPFATRFAYSNDATVVDRGHTFKVMNVTVVPCSSSPGPGKMACVCPDCLAMCPALP